MNDITNRGTVRVNSQYTGCYDAYKSAVSDMKLDSSVHREFICNGRNQPNVKINFSTEDLRRAVNVQLAMLPEIQIISI